MNAEGLASDLWSLDFITGVMNHESLRCDPKH